MKIPSAHLIQDKLQQAIPWQEYLARPAQTLKVHCENVSALTSTFSSEFGAGTWGRIIGYLHDFGKGRPEWQRYLETGSGQVNHAPESAAVLLNEIPHPGLARLAAYCVYGHHTSLPDWSGMLDAVKPEENYLAPIPDASQAHQDMIVELQKIVSGENSFDILPLLIRMLFSSLVDADRLDAERAETPEKSELRTGFDSFETLQSRFDAFMSGLSAKAKPTKVNRIRAGILAECLAKAECPRGFFELCVPTGGGKTLASMAFALRHLQKHTMSRIISVIPYNSIIEQTADVYKRIFGVGNVLEHHSQFDPGNDMRAELAMENWDAPIIVTTTVQLFESLLQGRASGSRKIHNLTNSIIILDEAQKIPPEHMNSILSTLRGLVDGFGCTIVLCSATIPNLKDEIGIEYGQTVKGLPEAIRIIDDSESLAAELSRTTIRNIGTRTLRELAAELDREEQVMCIVNTRQRCKELFDLLATDRQKYHLSAAMCPAHRRRILAAIRDDLKNGRHLTVIATSLVEAGVDLDFRCVYREIAGLDSIAQAAGRCNREGLHETGNVFVFEVPETRLFGTMECAVNAVRDGLTREREFQPFTPQAYLDYFKRFYVKCSAILDKDDYAALIYNAPDLKYAFRSFGERFQMIDDQGHVPLVVLYHGSGQDDGPEKLIAELRERGPSRSLFRKLQAYTVNILTKDMENLMSAGYVEELHGVFFQVKDGIYDNEHDTGFQPGNRDDKQF